MYKWSKIKLKFFIQNKYIYLYIFDINYGLLVKFICIRNLFDFYLIKLQIFETLFELGLLRYNIKLLFKVQHKLKLN